jgi:hypothetical protein
MMAREIWVFTVGDVLESDGVLTVSRRPIRVIGVSSAVAQFDPGQCFVTSGALARLGADGVVSAIDEHVSGKWWSDYGAADSENNVVEQGRGAIYNVDSGRLLMCISYIGHETTLLLSEEY